MRICKVPDCNEPINSKSLCAKHYHQMRSYGEIGDKSKTINNEFIIDKNNNHAYIITHNLQGLPMYKAKIDIDDLKRCKLQHWGANIRRDKNNVFSTIIDGERITLPRFILNISDSKEQIIHKNDNTSDCTKSNIYVVSRCIVSQNNKMNARNTSGHKGVYPSKNKWNATIIVNRKKIHLGTFVNINDAIIARQKAEQEYYTIIKDV